MSGFEIAGLVLGSFPLAIEALDRYREVAKRCGFWYKIQLEHKRCKDNLTFYRLVYKQQLRLLLLPLVLDESKIEQLLADPRGGDWKDPAVADLLRARLDDSYEPYERNITAIDEVVKKLNHELAIDKDAIQQNVYSPKGPKRARIKYAATKEGMEYHLYKLKFSNGASVRSELFTELKDLLGRMKSLLTTSDEVFQLVRDRATSAKNLAVIAAICNFWVQANKLYHALASVWNCCCPHQHSARLLLQHPEPTRKNLDFEVMIDKARASSWEIYQTKIVQGDGLEAIQAAADGRSAPGSAMRLPYHRTNQPARSAMRVLPQVSSPTGPGVPPPTVNLTVTTRPANIEHRQITSLCAALNDGDDGCCGFLPEKDCRYYVYRLARLHTKAVKSVTLEEILGGQAQPPPTRCQRYTLSVILASSFLQLLETPWLPTTLSKSDIVFTSRPEEPNLFALDQPQLRRGLTSNQGQVAHPTDFPSKSASVHDFLDLLGIILLELCFGKLLKDQPCRRNLSNGANELEKMVFDTMGARKWQEEVVGEAGPIYAHAVAWCLGGNRSCLPAHWRRKMLEEVVQPLEQCRQHLGGGPEAGWTT